MRAFHASPEKTSRRAHFNIEASILRPWSLLTSSIPQTASYKMHLIPKSPSNRASVCSQYLTRHLIILPLSLLFIATSAQTPGSTQSVSTYDPDVSLAITWGTQPIDSWSLYAGAAFEAQGNASVYEANNMVHDVVWDYCVHFDTHLLVPPHPPVPPRGAAKPNGPNNGGADPDVKDTQSNNCTRLHMEPLSTIRPISYPELAAVTGTMRVMAFHETWGLEAKFRIVSHETIVGTGWVANGTTTKGEPAIAVLQQPGGVGDGAASS